MVWNRSVRICACVGAIFGLGIATAESAACTVFFARAEEAVFFATNEDWPGPEARVWSRAPEAGRLGYLYFGFEADVPQGGVNSAGVVFDGLGLPEAPARSVVAGPTERGAAPLFRLLESCRTTAEAVQLLTSGDWDWLHCAQFLVADRTGAAVIVGPAGIVWAHERSLVATNTAATEPPEVRRRCARYRLAEEVLGGGSATLARCREALSAAHQEGETGGTQYSMIYDLRAMTVHVYWSHDYERVHAIDIAQWLHAPSRSERLADLVGETFAALERRRRAGGEQNDAAWVLLWLVLAAGAWLGFAVAVVDLREPKERRIVWRPVALLLLALVVQPLLLVLPWLILAKMLNLPAGEIGLLRQVAIGVGVSVGGAVLLMRLRRSTHGFWPERRSLLGGGAALLVVLGSWCLG